MIPPFNNLGVLPSQVGSVPYVCSRDEFEARFVGGDHPSPWRRALFDGWDLVRMSVEVVSPMARWWIWGSLTSNRAEPMFGELAVVDAALLVPAAGLRKADSVLLEATRQSAEKHHRVDLHAVVYLFDDGDPRQTATDLVLSTVRRRASVTFVDDSTKELIDAGFVEVRP